MAVLQERPREAIICGKWSINFLQHDHRSGRPTFEKSYLDEIDDHLVDASANATAMEFLLENLPQKLDVVEYFGGAGIQSTIIQELLEPNKHIILEKDDGCVRQLRWLFNFCPQVSIFQGDATQLIGYLDADVYVLDWNSWTIYHWSQWQQSWDLMMSRLPKAVIWFDSSWSYFHMNRERYGRRLRRKLTTRQSYTLALSSFFKKRYGYEIVRAAYCPRGAYYMLQGGISTLVPKQEKRAYPNSGGFVWKTSE